MSTTNKPNAGVAWLDLLKLVVIPVAFLAGGAVISIEVRMGRMAIEIQHLTEHVLEVKTQLKDISLRLRTLEKESK